MHPQSSDSRMTLQEYEELLEVAQKFVGHVREISGDEMQTLSAEDRKLLPKFMVRECTQGFRACVFLCIML